jgi:sodium transport system permease protein
MSTFWAVFKKEWLERFRDRRGLLISILTFGLAVPVISIVPYALILFNIFNQMSNQLEVAVSGLEQAPKLAEYSGGASQVVFIPVADAEAEVRRDAYTLGMVIPTDFEARIASGQPVTVEIISKQAQVTNTAATRLESLLLHYRRDLATERLAQAGLGPEALEPFQLSSRVIVTESRFQRSFISWMLVFFITFYAFTLSSPNAISATAGEKERLSMEVLLLSPASRAGILMGKIAYVITYGFANLALTAVSYTLTLLGGLLILANMFDMEELSALNNAMGGAAASEQQGSLPGISPEGLLMISLLVMMTVLIFTVLQFVVGIWSRNENQANGILSIVNLLPSLTSMVFFIDSYQPENWHYLIPLFSQTLLIPDMLVNRFEAVPLLYSFASSIAVIVLLLWAMSWMMNREEIIYRY